MDLSNHLFRLIRYGLSVLVFFLAISGGIAQDSKEVSLGANWDTLTLAGGCFWKLEYVFQELEGVIQTEVGYSGGKLPYPNYQYVSSGRSGHVEAVRVIYDEQKIKVEDLLAVFWQSHDSSKLLPSPPQKGSSYRSIIFYHCPNQKEAAQTLKEILNENTYKHKPIQTLIWKARPFYPASTTHQNYYLKRGGLKKSNTTCFVK